MVLFTRNENVDRVGFFSVVEHYVKSNKAHKKISMDKFLDFAMEQKKASAWISQIAYANNTFKYVHNLTCQKREKKNQGNLDRCSIATSPSFASL